MTDDDRHAEAKRIAWRVMADAIAEHQANPAAGTEHDIIAKHIAAALTECQRVASEMVAEAAGAMGRKQA